MAAPAAPRPSGQGRSEPIARRRDPASSLLAEAGDLVYFALSVIRALPTVPRYASEVLRQTSILLRGSTIVITVALMFFGITVVNFAYSFLRSAGAADYTGLYSGLTAARAAVPIMFGYIFATKVAAGFAAEIGTMRIAEEIDAYEAEGVNPLSYVVGTRVIGAVLFAPIIGVVALLAVAGGGYVSAIPVLDGLPVGSFWRYHWESQTVFNQITALGEVMVTSVVMGIIGCYYGYKASGGPAGVGSGVARSLTVNITLAHFLVPLYVAMFYGLQAYELPIGG